jgi:hypothetical protein
MRDDPRSDDTMFEILTPLRFRVRVTRRYWNLIVSVKHPAMRGRERDVRQALEHPEQIRVSKSDPNVYLFYKTERVGRWVCVVSRRENDNGFLITTYPTDAIKEGTQIWPE